MKYLFYILICCTCSVQAQDSLVSPAQLSPLEIQFDSVPRTPLSLSTNLLENFRNDNKFNYDEIEETSNWWTDFKNWLSRIWYEFWDWLVGDYDPNGFLGFIIGVLPYLIIAGVIIFMIWLFYRLNPGAKLLKSPEDPQLFFTEEEEIIKSKNIQSLIDKAIQGGNYRLAVRYYYLMMLQSLSEKEIITYQFDKTNTDYFKEISEERIHKNFKKVTNVYDYIWYGNFNVTQENFSKAQERFTELSAQIKDV